MSATVDLSQAWANANQATKTNNEATKPHYWLNKKLSGGVLLGFALDAKDKDGRRIAKGATLRFCDFVIELSQKNNWPSDEMHEITIEGEKWYFYHSTGDRKATDEEKTAWDIK